MKVIQILIDNPNSWMVPFASKFAEKLKEKGYESRVFHSHEEVEKGDLLVLLSCEKKFTRFEMNKYNLVVHESNLPLGKGWSPLTHQILEGKNKIPIILLEADKEFDSGDILLKDYIRLNGTELIDEIRIIQAEKTFKLIETFLLDHKNIKGIKQSGVETFYPKRSPSDSELDKNKSLIENFNLLRVVDNHRYPGYFIFNDVRYRLKIYRDE